MAKTFEIQDSFLVRTRGSTSPCLRSDHGSAVETDTFALGICEELVSAFRAANMMQGITY
ncbi:hypothetical protein A3K71_03495 [archaeon RBG_16_50_20]|nr:MAG: hypothetical protein A3K71_03495 [archaeon RBG_16_50_20]